MLRILWVEDQLGGKQTELFGDRPVTLITNFDEAEAKINSAIDEFDIVVLDIDLDQSEVTDNVRKHATSYELEASEFLKESGMTLFLTLLEKGFPKERIVFLTANSDKKADLLDKLQRCHEKKDFDSVDNILDEIQNGLGDEKIDEYQKLINTGDMVRLISYLKEHFGETSQSETPNTYNSFCDAYKRCRIQPPEAINKNLNDVKKHVSEWLDEHEANQYLVLRRGIIDGCKFAKSLPKENVYFNNFIPKQDSIQHEDIVSYFQILESFLPLREPQNKQAIYKLFVRTLSHEWEVVDPKKIQGLAWIMKNVRNWVTHNSSLFGCVDEKLLSYLFIINFRLIFDFDSEIQAHELILLVLFSDALSEQLFKDKAKNDLLKPDIVKAYLDLKNKVLDEKGKDCVKISDGFYFNELANNIQQSNSPLKDDKRLFSELLYQMFWLTTSNPYVGTKDRKKTLEIKFYDFNYLEKPYIEAVARHIYNDSF